MAFDLQRLLAEGARRGASDLHLTAGLPPCLRLHGDLSPLEGEAPFEAAEGEELASRLLRSSGGEGDGEPPPLLRRRLSRNGSLDGALTAEDGARWRFSVFRRQGTFAAAFRRLEERFRSLAELGLPEGLHALADLRDGLVVVSGPTGAGKSTTLATILDRINRTRPVHLVTIEDPIEYLHRPERAVVNQRQVGLDAPSFHRALVAALRQDPDVILVGEARDLPTIRTALTAAETGHLVFTTLHAGDCVSSIERIVASFPAAEQEGARRQVALVLRAVVAQRLLPALPGRTPDGPLRLPACEVLLVTPAVSNLIATGKAAQIYSAMETGQGSGMQTLEQDLARLLAEGRISEGTALAAARNPEIVKDRVALVRRRRG